MSGGHTNPGAETLLRIGPALGKTAIFLAFLAVNTGSFAQTPPDPPSPAGNTEPSTRKEVISGWLQKIDPWYATKPDCTAAGYPEVRVVTPPAHGTITSEKGEAFPNFPDGNVRKACNKHPVPATWISYESHPGFAGSDSLAVDIVFPSGRSRRVKYDVEVLASPPSPVGNTEPSKRKVVSGRPWKIDKWYLTKPDCTAAGYPEVRVVTPPTHGTITSEKGETFPNFPDGNVRKVCNKQQVPATWISYESHPGFVGSDSLVVDVGFLGGQPRRVTYDLKIWASPPVRISGPNPQYPSEARMRGLEGRVIAQAHVDSAGNVTTVVIKESPHELLSEEVIAAIQKWKFKPPIEDGEPVAFDGEYDVVFKLTDRIPRAERREQSL